MEESIKISVIVPIYNADKYLKRCVFSILNQSYTNIEIILINDGSRDRSEEICCEFQAKDKRVKYVSQCNQGVSFARKKGLALAEGDYITFVDADDYIDKSMYMSMVQVIDERKCDIVECGYILVDELDTFIGGSSLRNEIIEGKRECVKSFIQCYNSEFFLWNKLYSKNLFDNMEMKEFSYSEDYLWNVYLHGKCKSKIVIDNKLYYYLKNSQGACSKIANVKKIDGILAGIEARNYLLENYCELTNFATKYILDYSRVVYLEMVKNYKERKKECKKIREIYNKYYSVREVKDISSVSNLCVYWLFKVSPCLYIVFDKGHRLFKWLKRLVNFVM